MFDLLSGLLSYVGDDVAKTKSKKGNSSFH